MHTNLVYKQMWKSDVQHVKRNKAKIWPSSQVKEADVENRKGILNNFVWACC